MSVNLGINIKAHTGDAMRGIAQVKLALRGLHGSHASFQNDQKQSANNSRMLNRSLFEQSRAVKGLTGDFVSLRNTTRTFALRGAITGLTALTSALNSAAVTATTLLGSLTNLAGAGAIGVGAGLAAGIQAAAVLQMAWNKRLQVALTSSGKTQEKAMARLTKPARDFVHEMKSFSKLWDQMTLLSQKGLFPGLVRAMEDLKVLAPVVKHMIYDTGQSMGYLAERFAEMAAKRGPELNRFFTRNIITLQRFGRSAENIGFAFLKAFNVAGPLIGHITKDVEKFSRSMLHAFESKQGTATLKSIFDDLGQSWKNWTSIFGNVGKGLFSFWRAIQPVVHEVESAIKNATKPLSHWIDRHAYSIQDYFRDSLKPMGAFLKALGALGKLWVAFSKAGNDDAVKFFDGIRTKVIPILKDLFLYIDGNVLPKIGTLIGSFLDFLHASLPGIKSLLSVFKPLADALVQILQWATSIVKTFDNMGSVAGAIATLGVGITILSGWKMLRREIALTLLMARKVTGVAPNAVIPKGSFGGALRGFAPIGFVSQARRGFGFPYATSHFKERLAEGYENAYSRGLVTHPDMRERYPANLPGGARFMSPMETGGPPVRPGVGGGGRFTSRRTLWAYPGDPMGFSSRSLSPQAMLMQPYEPYRGRAYRQGVQMKRGAPSFVPPTMAPGLSSPASRRPVTSEARAAEKTYTKSMEKATKTSVLGGFKSALTSPTGLFRSLFGLGGFGPAIALVAGPAIVAGIIQAIHDDRPKIVKELDTLRPTVAEKQKNTVSDGGLFAGRFADPRITKLQGALTQAVKDNDVERMKRVAAALQKIADTSQATGQKTRISEIIGDIKTLEAVTQSKLLGAVAPDFATFAENSKGKLYDVNQALGVLQMHITEKLPVGSRAFKDAMASSFGQAASAIKAGMDAGTISIKNGMREIERMMRRQLKWLGLSPEQARNISNGNGQGGQYGNPNGNNGAEGGAPIVPSHTPTYHGPNFAVGGFFLGSKGQKGRDTIPMQVGDKSVVAGAGEYVGIFNHTQQKAFDSMAKRQGYGSMEGFFRGNARPHFMASGGVISKRKFGKGAHQKPNTYELAQSALGDADSWWDGMGRDNPNGPAHISIVDALPDGEQAWGKYNSSDVSFSQEYLARLNAQLGMKGHHRKKVSALAHLWALSAHERGHNLGYDHGPGGIMDPSIPSIPGRGVLWAQQMLKGMSAGGILQLGNRIVGEGPYSVSENSHFGGVHPVHVKGSLHYKDRALDVNADGAPGGEAKWLNKLASELVRQGWHVLWKVKGHFDHLHVDDANGGMAADMVAPQLKRVKAGGSGAVNSIAQAALDMVQGAGQSILQKVSGGGGAADLGEGAPAGGGKASGSATANMRIAKQMMSTFGWGPDQWPSWQTLGMGESGWTHKVNPTSGAFGIGQFLGATRDAYAKQGANSLDPFWQINAMGHYIKDRYGSPSEALAQWQSRNPHWYSHGGLVEASTGANMSLSAPTPGGSLPGTSPGDAFPPYDQPGTDAFGNKKPPKKKPYKYTPPGGTPTVGAGYGKSDFKPKRKMKAKKPSRNARRLGKVPFKFPTFTEVDPVTGEVIDLKFKRYDYLQTLVDDWGIDLDNLTGRQGLTTEESIVTLDDGTDVINSEGNTVNGKFIPGIKQYVDEQMAQLDIHEGRSIPGGLGKGIMGALVEEKDFLSNLPTKKAIKEYGARLSKIRKMVMHKINLRKKYNKKLGKLGGKFGWQKAVSANNDIITAWSNWKRDARGESPEADRRADHEMDRLRGENKWLRDHKPAPDQIRGAVGGKTADQLSQVRADLRYLTGDPEIGGWNPQSGGVAAMVTSGLINWRAADDTKNTGLQTLKSAIPSEQLSIDTIRSSIEDWSGTKLPSNTQTTTAHDDLLKQIGEDVLKGNFLQGLQANVLNEFNPLLNGRLIGAFAHGGPVDKTGMALVHKGEFINPAPDGPYRNGVNAAPNITHGDTVVELHMRDRAGAFVELVDSRIRQVAPGAVSQDSGTRTRRIVAARGGSR